MIPVLNYIENEVINNPNLIRIHRTSVIPQINKGLFMNSNNLDSTSVYLSKESTDKVIEQIKNWKHGTGNYFVIIEIPIELYIKNEMDSIIAFTNELNSYNNVSESGATFKLPSKYIKGYIDTTSGMFIANSNYLFSKNNPNREEEIIIAKEEMEKGYIFNENGQSHLISSLHR